MYNSSLPTIFGCKYFADALWKVAKARDIEVNLKTNLVEVQGDKNTAIFANVDNPNERKSVQVGAHFQFISIKTRLILLKNKFWLKFAIEKRKMEICKRNELLSCGAKH